MTGQAATRSVPERLPRVGELVQVRSRRWLVDEVIEPKNRGQTCLVRLSCADDDAQGQSLDVLWDYELDRLILEEEGWADLAAKGFDQPRQFAAFLHTLRWNCVTATDPNLFQAPFRAGIKIDAYQMEPLRKALRLPRVNLFIADDTGLGKTIEAGLIARELLLRKKAKSIVVATPPSVLEQWKAELEERFGLVFELLDRAYPASSIRERIYADNETKQFGILLYTGSPDAEGTLGGLVQQARHIEDHLAQALRMSALCSNDPVCAQHAPGESLESRWLHGAACHGCALVAETSCEMRNDYLDRALVVPVLGVPDAAFFQAVRVIDALLDLPSHLRERLASALESGLLGPSPTTTALRSVLGSREGVEDLVASLLELGRLGISGPAAAVWLRTIAQAAARTPKPDLVWSGPEVPGLHARDTRRVYEELLGCAKHSIWASTSCFFDGPKAFEVLARRMEAAATLRVTLLLNIQRKRSDTTASEQLVRRFADRFWKTDWPGSSRPNVLYDPRALDPEGPGGVLHAKAVVADDEAVFVTSANLTEAALDRNIELGVLIRDRALALTISGYFRSLIDRDLLKPLPLA